MTFHDSEQKDKVSVELVLPQTGCAVRSTFDSLLAAALSNPEECQKSEYADVFRTPFLPRRQSFIMGP
eukprot:1019529-Pelagomonas_calceolata.AAC.6